MNRKHDEKILADVWNELIVEFHEIIGSTNDAAKQHVKNYPQDEILIISKKQTKGRGRQGRTFYSDIEHGLYFSLAIHPKNNKPEKLPLYTIAAATALVQAIEQVLGMNVQVKWVNDLFYQGRKISGILSEAVTCTENNQITAIIIGIGLNLAGSFHEADSSTQEVAGTLYDKLPANFDEKILLREFLIQFRAYHEELESKVFLPIYEKSLLGINQEIHYQRKDTIHYGIIQGVNSYGQLIVKNKQGELLTLFGEEIHFSSQQFRKK